MREWHTVTVAFSASSSCAIGLPNRFERPTTTASAPSSSTPAWASSSITPAGVHGRRPGRPSDEQAGVDRGQPVDVLLGPDQAGEGGAVEVPGDGQLQEDPADSPVGAERLELLCHLLVGGVRGETAVERDDPDLLAGALLVRHVDRRGGIVSDEDRREARRVSHLLCERGHIGRGVRS